MTVRMVYLDPNGFTSIEFDPDEKSSTVITLDLRTGDDYVAMISLDRATALAFASELEKRAEALDE